MALKLETDTQVKLDLKSTRIFVLVTFSIFFFSFVTPMDYTVHGILQARILEWLVGEHRYMGILTEKLYATIFTDNCYCN